jgi:putative transposase
MLWEVSDPLWERMLPLLLAKDPVKPNGRPRTDQRRILDGIIFKIRTGCQWNAIPKVYGSDTTIYRTFKRWQRSGIWPGLWSLLAEQSPELGRMERDTQAPEAVASRPFPPQARGRAGRKDG